MRVLTTVIAHLDSLAGSPSVRLCVYIRRAGILSLLSALKKIRPLHLWILLLLPLLNATRYVPSLRPCQNRIRLSAYIRHGVSHRSYFQKTHRIVHSKPTSFTTDFLFINLHIWMKMRNDNYLIQLNLRDFVIKLVTHILNIAVAESFLSYSIEVNYNNLNRHITRLCQL